MSAVKIYTKPITGRLFTVGDIHGCYNLLMARLAEIGFDFDNDLLVSVGDLVDRGEQNLQCIELIDKPWFEPVRGNHEQFCIEGFISADIARQHQQSNNGGAWFYRTDSHQQARIVNIFNAMPIALEINHQGKKYGFVHAHVEQNDWEEFKQILDGPADSQRSPVDMAMWSRERVYARRDDPQYGTIMGVDLVFMGHTVLPEPMRKHNCIYIDTGAVHTTKLTIVEIA